jgi:osmoprotectant transport system ATP-binding protein
MTGIDSGSIRVMGKNMENWDKILLRRQIGYVIQQGGLFPHLTIRQNMAFVLSISSAEKEVIEKRITELAALMGFDERQLNAFPSELSGGQQQRVGVARALAAKPEIVLLDEPFSALDNITRRNLQKEIKDMHRKMGITLVMVTHDLHEAFSLGTHVAVMNQGAVEQFDSPENIKKNPVNKWVKEFINV